jgi:hypothetical protein
LTAEIRRLESLASLRSTLSQHAIILGEADEATQEYFRISVYRGEQRVSEIGVLSFGVGLLPKFVSGADDVFLVGYNKKVDVFRVNNTVTHRSGIGLDSLFYDFEPSDDGVIVICEADLVSIYWTGQEKWWRNTPQITRWVRRRDTIWLETDPGPPLTIRLRDGRVVPMRR